MPIRFIPSVTKFIENDWNEMGVYSLTREQKNELLDSNKLIHHRLILPKGNKFDEHAHEHGQLLLIERGFLTHYANGKEYPQKEGELLVIPAGFLHTAQIGEHEDLAFVLFDKIRYIGQKNAFSPF
jgi:quercetin dioxygenase-like cupin family protein